MGTFYENLALSIFSLQTGIDLVRKKMKKCILEEIDPNKGCDEDNDFTEKVSMLKRTPDAVAILSMEVAVSLGLPPKRTILFCEAEHTSPIPENALWEYAALYDLSEDDPVYSVAVVVIERYGRWQILDLPSLHTILLNQGVKS